MIRGAIATAPSRKHGTTKHAQPPLEVLRRVDRVFTCSEMLPAAPATAG